MDAKFLSPEETFKLIELTNSSYRPKEIIDLREKIKAETRVAELRASITGVIDYALVQRIVEMKLCLDGLYCDWTQGKLP